MGQWEIITGDCLEVMRGMDPPNGGFHVVTDPPYGEHVHSKPWQSKMLAENGDARAASDHAGIDFDPITEEVARGAALLWATRGVRWCLVFADLEGINLWRASLGGAGLDYVRTCIWDKVDSSPQFTGDRPASACEAIVCSHPPGRKRWNGGGRRNLFSYAVNAERGSKPHPTTKPLPLMCELVGLFTQPGDLVLDPFCGSGTTGVACLRLGRRFIGIEKDPKYADLARERLRAEENGSTLKATRAGQVPLFGGSK